MKRHSLVFLASGPHWKIHLASINLLVFGSSSRRARRQLSDQLIIFWNGWVTSVASSMDFVWLCNPSSLHSPAMQSRQRSYLQATTQSAVEVKNKNVKKSTMSPNKFLKRVSSTLSFIEASAERKLDIRRCSDEPIKPSLDSLTWLSLWRGNGWYYTRCSWLCLCPSYAKSTKWAPWSSMTPQT